MSDPLLPVPDKTEDHVHQEAHHPRSVSAWAAAQVYLCIVLHVILVLVHLALIVVIAHHYEHRVTVETGGPANRLSTVVTAATQTIGTAYSAVLVFLTQRLALDREFHARQALSSLHDKSSAWLGIGSSFVTLWGQLKVRTAPMRVFVIAAYLVGIFVFHITTPSLFNVAPYNVTVTVRQTTAQSRVIPNISSVGVIDNQLFPEAVYSILEVLPLYLDLDTPGLLNSTLYDVITPLENATGEVAVSATQFEVDCGAIRGGRISGFLPSDIISEFPDEWANVSVGVPGVVLDFISVANPSLVVTSPVYDNHVNYPFVVITTTVNVTDDSGAVQSVYPIDPWAIEAVNNSSILYDRTQLLACNVNLKNTIVNVSATTGKLLREPFDQPQATWHDWQLPQPSDDPMLSVLSIIPEDAPQSDQRFCVWLQNSSSTEPTNTCYYPSLLETFLQIYLTPQAPAVTEAPLANFSSPLLDGAVTLTDLNKVLSNAFATVYWYAGNIDASRISAEIGTTIVQKLTNEATVQTQSIRSQLNLNAAPLYIGLGASMLLLALSILLIGCVPPIRPKTDLGSTGLLQLTWLLSQEPRISERIADTADPTDENLRRAGLFEVDMGAAASQSLARRNSTL